MSVIGRVRGWVQAATAKISAGKAKNETPTPIATKKGPTKKAPPVRSGAAKRKSAKKKR